MKKSSKQKLNIWLSHPKIYLGMLSYSPEIRCTFIADVKNLLQHFGNFVTLDSFPNQEPLPNNEEFFRFIQTNNQVYQASLSRQLSADLSPDVEETTFKDTAKSWFIKTADFGDTYDQLLQHPDGRFTQLLEDITRYHQIFQQGYDKIILIRPTTYTGYDIQLTAAMQCLGYSKEQFQFIIVQPIKLYAFHKPSQQLHPIPDLPPNELIKAIGPDSLRWHSFSTPLTETAPINISTAGQPTPTDSLYRVQTAYARCCDLLQQAHQQGMIQLDDHWQSSPLTDYTWDNSYAEKLAFQVQAIPEILQQSAAEIAPHLLTRHLEAMSDNCHLWYKSFNFSVNNCILLLAIQQTFFDLLENILEIKTPVLTQN